MKRYVSIVEEIEWKSATTTVSEDGSWPSLIMEVDADGDLCLNEELWMDRATFGRMVNTAEALFREREIGVAAMEGREPNF